MAGANVERKRGYLAPRIEGLLVQNHSGANQRVGVGRQEIEVGEVAIIGVEIVHARFLGFQVYRRRWLVAPTIGAYLNRIEPFVLRIGQREVCSEKLGA